MNNSIVLIGPAKTGKTTVSTLLGTALDLPVIDLDVVRWGYYNEIGYDAVKAKDLIREGGLKALHAYWKPFNLHAVERVLRDYPSDHVIAFGWPHSIYEDEDQFRRAEAALASFPYVVLLIPSPDIEETYQVFRQRYEETASHFTEGEIESWLDETREFITHPSHIRLARITVYTLGKSPDETCQEIIQVCRPG